MQNEHSQVTSCNGGKDLSVDNRPLITFALFAYNQEKFIREALAGAFAQTYSPLEIILSDDCSTDRTFEIMQEMTASYRGHHRVILNRNSQNLGVANHVNYILDLAQGDYIVLAAGDDISLPHRVTIVVQCICKYHNPITAVIVGIEPFGIGKGFSMQNQNRLYTINDYFDGVSSIGAGLAISKQVYRQYGLIRNEDAEDGPLIFRALLLGTVVQTDEIAVLYRRSDVSLTAQLIKHRYSDAHVRTGIQNFRNYQKDIDMAQGLKNIPEQTLTKLKLFINWKIIHLHMLHAAKTRKFFTIWWATRYLLSYPRLGKAKTRIIEIRKALHLFLSIRHY